MHDILKKIFIKKQQEVEVLKKCNRLLMQEVPARKISPQKSLKTSLKNEKLSIIAEIKRRSPSKGELALIDDPLALAQKYIAGGANAISILTDEEFFGGSLEDLRTLSLKLKMFECPLLRKDFIIDPIQIYESVKTRADAILLIVAMLGKSTRKYLEIAKKMNIEALVEVHTKEELIIAIDSEPEIIGINNRDLNTFFVDINTSLELVNYIPANIVKVAESGVDSPEIANKLRIAGFDAILVGETLVRSSDPALIIKKFREPEP